MRTFLTILSFVGFLLAKGQETKEEFLNKITPSVIDTSIDNYFLFSQTETLDYNRKLDPDIKRELLKVLSEATATDILNNLHSDTVPMLWNQNLLLNASLVNAGKADTLSGNIVFNYTGLNKRQQKKLNKDLNAKRSRVYYFSRPIFDRTKQFALIQMRYACGTACGNGCLYIFKSDHGRWIKLYQMNCWIV